MAGPALDPNTERTMSDEFENDGAFNEKLIEEVLSAYPEKFAKRRRKHLTVAKAAGEEEATAEDGTLLTECEVKSNIKSIPGVMTIRGCAYAGSKGVVWGPVKDMVHISHGPVGCGHYSWSQRRNYYTCLLYTSPSPRDRTRSR